MFKPTQIFSVPYRRLRLTTKHGPRKGYYKGNRTGKMGEHTKYGGFIVDLSKVRTYICPEPSLLKLPKLLPFVARQVEKPKPDERMKTMTHAELYLTRWKEENGQT